MLDMMLLGDVIGWDGVFRRTLSTGELFSDLTPLLVIREGWITLMKDV